jgi:hypothetical protein
MVDGLHKAVPMFQHLFTSGFVGFSQSGGAGPTSTACVTEKEVQFHDTASSLILFHL